MAMWESCTVTRAGAQLLMKMQALEIYAAKYGIGTVDEENLKFQTDISEPGGVMSIVDIKSYDWGFEIVIRTDNSKLKEETIIKQVGFFARIKGSGEEGVLFAIAQDETGDRVPTPEDMPNFNLEFTIAVAADANADISIVIDPTTTATVGYVGTVRHEIEISVYELIDELKIDIGKKPDVHVISERIRAKNKPDYGFVGSNEFKLRLNTSAYTGTAEIAILREDNTLLDADNMTQNAGAAKSGDLIVKGGQND